MLSSHRFPLPASPQADQADGDAAKIKEYLEGKHWSKGKVIGTGAYCTCFLARDVKSGTIMAVKQASGLALLVVLVIMAECLLLSLVFTDVLMTCHYHPTHLTLIALTHPFLHVCHPHLLPSTPSDPALASYLTSLLTLTSHLTLT